MLFQHICEAIEHAHQHQVSTNMNVLAYSKEYASPEQKAGDYLTQQSDIYSMGKILTLLFPNEMPNSDIFAVQQKSTQTEPSERYISVLELRQEITRIIEYRPLTSKKNTPLYTLRCLIKRRPLQSLLASALIILSLSFSIVLVLQNQKLEQEKQIAENMMYEVTRLLFHAKGTRSAQVTVGAILELTRRRILSNPDLPTHIKQKMLLAMMTPAPKRSIENSQTKPHNASYLEE